MTSRSGRCRTSFRLAQRLSGILHQHQGKISWQRDRLSGITIRIELPVISPAPEKSAAAASRENGNLNVRLSCPQRRINIPPRGRLTNAGSPRRAKSFETTPRALRRSREVNSRPGFRESDSPCSAAAQQFATSFAFSVHRSPREQYVIRSDPLPRAQRKIPRCRNQHSRFHFLFSGIKRVRNASFDHSRKSPASAGSAPRQSRESAAQSPPSKPSSAARDAHVLHQQPPAFTKLS